MSKQTTTYQLRYFEEGDVTTSVIEGQRWQTIDAQLGGLYSVLGNGIISGWNILASNGLTVVVTPGIGIISLVSVKSIGNTELSNLVPNARNYVYAVLTPTSYFDQSAIFSAYITLSTPIGGSVYLGYVDTFANAVATINTDGRSDVGFIELIKNTIAIHRHIGGSNPSPVDLGKDVTGILNESNLPNLDASIIKSGTIDVNRLPLIDHITKLANQGVLTHAQLDSFVEALSLNTNSLMGETSLTDLLQLVLALKHIYPAIDDYLVNEIAIIPGISPDEYIDFTNTTAIVDTRTAAQGGSHTITGTASTQTITSTKTWDTEDEFNAATSSDIFVNSNSFLLDTEEQTKTIDTFENVDEWDVVTENLSSQSDQLFLDYSKFVIGNSSGKLVVSATDAEFILLARKSFNSEDWSTYKYIVFYLNTNSVEHGDIFFYLNDAFFGVQNSFTNVLAFNTPTVNVDTLQNGWQEIRVDISSFSRTAINQFGFMMSTQHKWDTSKGFDLNIDDVKLTSGIVYKDNGYSRFIFGNDNFAFTFDRVRWKASEPTDTQIKFRTKVGNSLADIQNSNNEWSSYSYTNGNSISLPENILYKYAEVEIYLIASPALDRSPVVQKVYLDYSSEAIEASFEFNTQDDWESGTNFNIDTKTSPGSLLISKPEEVNNIFYGTTSSAVQLDSGLSEIYRAYGSMLPRNTIEVLKGENPSLGLVTGISRGNDGNFWISDIDNNRIAELNKYGMMVRGYYGSFLSSTPETNGLIPSNFEVLHSIYNSDKGVLYVIFDQDIRNVIFNFERVYLKSSTQRFSLVGSTSEIIGSDHHILKTTIIDANKTALDKLVNPGNPSIFILDPYPQKRIDGSSSVTANFGLMDFELSTSISGNRIRVTLDGGVPQDILTNRITFSGLADGEHIINAQLVDSSGLITDSGAIAQTNFVINASGVYSDPYISIVAPKANQIYSSSPVTIEFNVDNFPIFTNGQHLRYTIDGGAVVNYYSTDPIVISNLTAGVHSIDMYLVDAGGTSIGYPYSSVESSFVVGLNPNATLKLYIDDDFGDPNATYIREDVDVANVFMTSIYSPVDIQLIPNEMSVFNKSGLPTVIVAKLESISDVSKGIFFNGHSVVQYDMDGNMLLSNNDAVIASSKDQAKTILGSVEKIGASEILIGDAVNKRSIIVNVSEESSLIEWELESDKYISDFHMVYRNDVVISVTNNLVSDPEIFIRNGTTVIWENNSSVDITIYSGTVTSAQFQEDPDLTLYGDDFRSSILTPGQRYAFKFASVGDFGWFAYPSILGNNIGGIVNVTNNRLSSRDQFVIVENDQYDSPFSSRVIKVDNYGNVLWSFGESFLCRPRDARPMLNGDILISC